MDKIIISKDLYVKLDYLKGYQNILFNLVYVQTKTVKHEQTEIKLNLAPKKIVKNSSRLKRPLQPEQNIHYPCGL